MRIEELIVKEFKCKGKRNNFKCVQKYSKNKKEAILDHNFYLF
jgi:hypothetical protein